jgi:diguanylate cyclase (GGDEF)-like protein
LLSALDPGGNAAGTEVGQMSRDRAPDSALKSYVLAVCLSGCGLLSWLIWSAVHGGLQVDPVPILALSVILVIVELRPIRISHGDGSVDEVTISSSFSLALMMAAPLLIAVGAQGFAALIDDVRQRKNMRRIIFNISQYTLTLTTSRVVYAALTHRGVLQDPLSLRPADLGPGLVAAAVFFVCNHVITTVVVALSLHEDPLRRLLLNLRYHVSTSGVLLVLAPVVVMAVEFSVMALPLLLMPIAAIHKSAKLAIQREAASLHDSLTELPNRMMFRQSVSALLTEADHRRSALMLIDLDYFKEINDTLGHHIGDLVLIEIADRLRAAVSDVAVIARLGGDEFAVLLPDADADTTEELSTALLFALSSPFVVESMRIDMGASIGVAMSPDHGEDVDTLLRRADVAMYVAKDERNTVCIYSYADDQNTVRRLALLGDLGDAIADGQIAVHYQPKADAVTGDIVGLEALARWVHPAHGIVMPDEFVPLAEHSGMMARLTECVLHQALDAVHTWRLGSPTLTVAVNVSPRQLSDRELPGLIAAALLRAGVPASALILEATETGAMATSARVQAVLRELHELGVRLAIDDFGSGATSLSYLGRLHLYELKIDKQFVLGLDDPINHAIVRSTIELGHNLGLRVVAEGVESLEIWNVIADLGGDVIQGYFLARPLSRDGFTRFLAMPARSLLPAAVTSRPEAACA